MFANRPALRKKGRFRPRHGVAINLLLPLVAVTLGATLWLMGRHRRAIAAE